MSRGESGSSGWRVCGRVRGGIGRVGRGVGGRTTVDRRNRDGTAGNRPAPRPGSRSVIGHYHTGRSRVVIRISNGYGNAITRLKAGDHINGWIGARFVNDHILPIDCVRRVILPRKAQHPVIGEVFRNSNPVSRPTTRSRADVENKGKPRAP